MTVARKLYYNYTNFACKILAQKCSRDGRNFLERKHYEEVEESFYIQNVCLLKVGSSELNQWNIFS